MVYISNISILSNLQIGISGFRKRDTKIKGKGERNQSNKLQLDLICKQWGARDICQTGN